MAIQYKSGCAGPGLGSKAQGWASGPGLEWWPGPEKTAELVKSKLIL